MLGGQKSALYLLELVLQSAVSHPVWVLETKLRFLASAVHTLKHWSSLQARNLLWGFIFLDFFILHYVYEFFLCICIEP